MKLRRTLYPVTVAIAIPLVLIVFILLNQGHFEQVSANLSKDDSRLESFFVWKGLGTPKIHSVKLNKEEEMDLIDSHISANAVEKNATDFGKVMVKKHQPDMSLQMESNHSTKQTNPEIIIHYSVFGINKNQKLEMETDIP